MYKSVYFLWTHKTFPFNSTNEGTKGGFVKMKQSLRGSASAARSSATRIKQSLTNLSDGNAKSTESCTISRGR